MFDSSTLPGNKSVVGVATIHACVRVKRMFLSDIVSFLNAVANALWQKF